MPSASAPARTISGRASASLAVRRRRPLPIQVIAFASPAQVTTRSPIFSASTGTSPASVRMRVPRQKQGACSSGNASCIGVTAEGLKVYCCAPLTLSSVTVVPLYSNSALLPSLSYPVNSTLPSTTLKFFGSSPC